MNRRNFLRSGGIFLLGASALPKPKRKSLPADKFVYETNLDETLKEQWLYRVTLNHKALENFSLATEEERDLRINMAHIQNADRYNPINTTEYVYSIVQVAKVNYVSDMWEIKLKFIKKEAGDDKTEKSFAKVPKLKCWSYNFVYLYDKAGKELQAVPYKAPGGDDGCFLTSACVNHKQLPDNCEELEVLRSLRDNYMLPSPGGLQLIKEYRTLGPALVSSINSCDNRDEIYEYLYDQLVCPSVEMVNRGRKEEAVEYYRAFIQHMKTLYL